MKVHRKMIKVNLKENEVILNRYKLITNRVGSPVATQFALFAEITIGLIYLAILTMIQHMLESGWKILSAHMVIYLVVIIVCFPISYFIMTIIHQLITYLFDNGDTKYHRRFNKTIDHIILVLEKHPILNMGRQTWIELIYSLIGLLTFFINVLYEDKSKNLLYTLILFYIIFNNKGKWNTLSSCFKTGGAKISIVVLKLMLEKSFDSILTTMIFLFETDRKIGNYSHMFLVFAAGVISIMGNESLRPTRILCLIIFFVGDHACKIKEKQFNYRILMHVDEFSLMRDKEYIDIDNVRVYYNLPHYTVYNMLSSVCLLNELCLL